MILLLSVFLQKSQEILQGYVGVRWNDLESLLTSWWSLHLRQLGHSQNSMELAQLELKNSCNSQRIAVVWSWKGWDSLLKIFFATWMESVTTMILETLSMEQAWLIPHLIANSSASVLVTNEAWWTVLVRGQFTEWTCKMNIAILFLMLVSVITRAVWGRKELWRTMSSNSWAWIVFISFSFLLTKLKEKRSEKLSIIWWPGKNLGLRGEKDGKIL